MHKGTWKNFERTVATFFGGKRTPLSGMSNAIQKGDVIHPDFFIEAKMRNDKNVGFVRIWNAYKEQKKAFPEKTIIIKIANILLFEYKDFEGYLEGKRNIKSVALKSKPIQALYEKTTREAENENRLPIIALKVMSRKGWLIGIERKNIEKVKKWLQQHKG